MSEGRARLDNVDWDDMPPTTKAFCSFWQRFLCALADCQVDKKRTCIWRFGILDSLILLLHPLFGKTNWIQKLEWHHKKLKANFFNTALEHFADIMAAPEQWSKKTLLITLKDDNNCGASSQPDFILNYFLSNFLSNYLFPPSPADRLEQLMSPCHTNKKFSIFCSHFKEDIYALVLKYEEVLKKPISSDLGTSAGE